MSFLLVEGSVFFVDPTTAKTGAQAIEHKSICRVKSSCMELKT